MVDSDEDQWVARRKHFAARHAIPSEPLCKLPVVGRRNPLTATAEENRAVLKNYGKDLVDLDPITCAGKCSDVDVGLLFHHDRHQQYRKYNMVLEKLELYMQIRKEGSLSHSQIENYSDSKLSDRMLSEFGPMDTNSEFFKGYFANYKKAVLKNRQLWIKKGSRGKRLDYTDGEIEERQERLKNSIEVLAKFCPSFKNLENQIFSEKVDWFQLPRLNFFCMDVNSPHMKVRGAEALIFEKVKESPSGDGSYENYEVGVLLPSKPHPLNFILMEPANDFPAEIMFEKSICTEQDALQLKSVINTFPTGVCVQMFIETYKANYESEPNYEPFQNFIDFCKTLPDIFLISDEVFPGTILLFPADFFGALKPVNDIMEKLWHNIKFIVNFHGGCISANEILPKLLYYFNLNIDISDWGFEIETFLLLLIFHVSPQRNFILQYNEMEEKYYLRYLQDDEIEAIGEGEFMKQAQLI